MEQSFTAESLVASVRSFVPGRLRLRHPALTDLSDDWAEGLVSWLRTKPGMRKVEFNRRVGSLLLLWDESEADWTFEELAREAAGLFAFFAPAGEAETQEYAEECVCGASAKAPSSEAEGKSREAAAEGAKPCARVKASVEAVAQTLEPAGEVLERCGQKVLDLVAPFVVPEKKAKAGGRTRRVAQNRLMGGALAGSTAALFLRSTGAHLALGCVFFGFLAVHLWQHRRVL